MRLYLKDYVTLCSAGAAMVSIALVFEGLLEWGCFFVWVAWVFDGLDGLVARLTGKKNKIGPQLDQTVDLLGCAIAPAVCVYGGYREILGPAWACALASLPVFFGVIRHARGYANPTEVRNLWVGLPRSYSGMGMAALVGSHLFQHPVGQWIGVAYVIVVPALGITTIGWQGRHHAGLKWHQKVSMIATFATFVAGLVILALGHGLAWFHDGLFFWMTGYILFACWGLVPREERLAYRRYIREWQKNF